MAVPCLQTFQVFPKTPEQLAFLEELSRNLGWSGKPSASEVFRRIDPRLWEHVGRNPVDVEGIGCVVPVRVRRKLACRKLPDELVGRLSGWQGLVVGEVEDRLVRMIPKEFLKDAHHWMILHGRYVCKARKPDCTNCLISDLCEYKGKPSL